MLMQSKFVSGFACLTEVFYDIVDEGFRFEIEVVKCDVQILIRTFCGHELKALTQITIFQSKC